MDEESGVKAPVTRLRRRLSVEAEDVSSPQPQSTPKKRSGRLAAKPLLDNIDENAPIPSPKTTRGRKSIARDLTEPEEKVVTPSRRSIRIKSNTSLTSETPLALASPRAKRFARRNSNASSDTEAPQTPILQQRKTRKNSDSVENLEKPQPQRKSKEFHKTPPKVAEKEDLQNTPPNIPVEVALKPPEEHPNESIIFAEEPQIKKPQEKRKSKELHVTPEKVQDKPELQKTPQNVPEKKQLQNTPQNVELRNSTSTTENIAGEAKEPPLQLSQTTSADEQKINSKELLKTPQKDAEQIAVQKTPNATEKIELKNPPTVENEVKVVTNQVKQSAQSELQNPWYLIQTPQKVPEIEISQTMLEKIQLQNSTCNSSARVATKTTVQVAKETSISAPKPDLQIPQKKRLSKELHQVPQKRPVVTELENVLRIEPENMVIPVNPHMLLNPFVENPVESRHSNDLYEKPLQKILETKELTVFLHDHLKCPNIKVATENPKMLNKPKELTKKILPGNRQKSKKCEGAQKIIQKSQLYKEIKLADIPIKTILDYYSYRAINECNNMFYNKLPNCSNGATLPSSGRKKFAESSINILSRDYSLPNSSNEATSHPSGCKSYTNVAEKSNNNLCKCSKKAEKSKNLSLEITFRNSSNETIPLISQRQSPRKFVENSSDSLPLDYSLHTLNSSNEALLPNSRCKTSRQVEKSNNLSLDISLPNSSIETIPLNSKRQSPRKAAENSIDILSLDYSLPSSSIKAPLSNSQCKSSIKAEKSKSNLSLDKSMPDSFNGPSPTKSTENPIDILPPDYSLPTSSNEAALPNSPCKTSRKAEKSNNLFLDISLPNSSVGAIPPDSQSQSPRKLSENSIDTLPPNNSPPISLNETLLPNSCRKNSRIAEKTKNNFSFDKSLTNSSNEALLPSSRRKSARLAEKSINLSFDKSLPNSLNRAIKLNSRRKSPKKSASNKPLIDTEDIIGGSKKRLPQEHPATEPIIIFPKNWGKCKPITKHTEIYFPKNWKKTIPISKQPENVLKTCIPETTNSADTLQKQMTTDFTFATDSEHSIIVYIDEDQANVDKLLQLSQEPSIKAESGDQCVPVVNRLDTPTGIASDPTLVNFNPLSKHKEKTESVSSQKGVEPMDIDESIPLNISITDYSKENLSEVDKQVEFEEPNKSKLAKSYSDGSERVKKDEEKACNENKSTLILSLANDESVTETNLGKSPIIPRKETVENLLNVSDVGKNRNSKKTNLTNITENKDTPLRHKNSNILGMQTSTPVTSTKHEIIVETNLNTSTKNISVSSRKSKTDSDLNDESSDEENMSALLMEAEDAGEDYESGDSRDESEKIYDQENEIHDKGETLDTDSSQEDGSDDDDYERDSFVVSSDQEDDDLLSGTGDDLSMSDKELTMAAKSKKKFNDRKLREQKKASKEMYASRHNKTASLNNSSDDSDNATKGIKPTKKKNRMRLDSSHELSALKSDADMSVSRKTNESKQVLDNNCNKSVVNELEITAVVDESIIQKTDPLKTAIKAEPMTPQKGFNISTVNISVRQDVEEVHLTGDASMMHANETSDPLQASMAFNNDEKSSSSGNEEIIQNYDSMLSELNKNKSQNKVKDHDISLNLNKKSKLKVNNPIVDQLNLTNTKKHKKVKNDECQDTNKSFNKMEVDSSSDSSDSTLAKDNKNKQIKAHDISLNQSKKSKRKEKPIFDQLNLTNTKERKRRITDQNQSKSNKTSIQTEADVTDETSSDSLDLKLLFPDDESDTSGDKKDKSHQSNEDFIPLKRTEGKTDLNKSKDVGDKSAAETSSSTKINKRLSELQNVDQIDGVTATENNSSSKKKNRMETSFTAIDSTETETIENELNVSKKKKNKKSKESFTVTDSTETETTDNDLNVSKKNKNRKSSEPFTVTDSNDNNLDVSIGCKKNKRKESLTVTDTEITEYEANNSVSSSKKKNRKATESLSIADSTDTDMIENEINLSVGKNKQKKKKSSESSTATDVTKTKKNANTSITSNKKKHGKVSESIPVADATEIDNQANQSLGETPGSAKKKKKKISESQSLDKPANNVLTVKTESAINTSLDSNNKKNRKASESLTVPESSDNASKIQFNSSLPLENAKKKKKLNLSVSLPTSQPDNENTVENINNSSKKKKHEDSESSEANIENYFKESVDDAPEEASSKKRKRKSSIIGEAEDCHQESTKLQNDSLLAAGGHKKKLKLCTEIEGEVKAKSPNTDEAMDEDEVENKNKKNKKSKLKKAVALENESPAASKPTSVAATSQDSVKNKQRTQTETTNQDRAKNIPDKKSRRKRKDREDDEGFEQTKVLKENFFDNIQISRLPKAFLERLENPKSKQPKNKKIVSTSAFIVEETVKRKNKPSHYLEQSIYLNSDSPEKKRNNKIEKPKVLPFVPTASTSGRGFTTNFQVKVCPQEVQFIAQSSDTVNFKNDYIQKQKLKKLGTYEMYKNQRKVKLSKF